MNKNTPTVTVKSAYDALCAAGFPKSFVARLLPEWWDNALFKTSTGAIQFASILKQRLGLDVRFAESGELEVVAKSKPVRYKKRVATQESELHVCASLAMALGRLARFCMDEPSDYLPKDPTKLAKQIQIKSGANAITFSVLLEFCWAQGVPVLFLKDLPRGSKRVTGMALQIDGNPVIVLGYQSDQNARQLFVLAHELAHLCLGHVASSGVLVDEGMDPITDAIERDAYRTEDAEERQADQFALCLLRNGHSRLSIENSGPVSAAQLANLAVKRGKELGVDPGHIILSYGREHDDWMLATTALGYFPDQSDATKQIKRQFMAHCQVDRLSDDNRTYLLSMQGF
ncbi:ImmA/IrrE family metallo-endopeptidase [Xanthomonas phaseoli]|uniref:IrrE N-terminal-like domain-containing protein n=1 Tax=Xanthomonas phaseoli pv. dieffenbachiae TaxID=92828 RepID=A0A1V9HBA6_9XANT|nr:ImmA/IrrE family metallo-endopeptidase [Xanthomonas phaseoli]MBO9790179.1 ImmA/IrrE family metallo-endopeptidase [Xanthomonas phaseoli pv. dieffenbachiae]MBO9833022.1 ImmA/IrrE family metallo-endopeptidase [Xanthomonas phaseoli pv. dieffenbachiae]MBO9838453.1 ImmA/IrrE family metallo-endopeptidase [Xanthomonas phaseoli pv. dieffenbachiae]MBO9842953.1 ImmA/IrrE family metallo-endopeptidase [Xanthomonas phaseoli pv. dieffenbachiae]MBO9863309.1 ImmA/IrrE family metallo-endopeptidase [Xanthomon